MPDANTRGSHVSYIATAQSECGEKVPLTYTLMQDNKVVRFLSSFHGVPTASSGETKPGWNKLEREYQEVYIPPVKATYDAGKVGSDLFGQLMAIIMTTYKHYHPWQNHHLWLRQGCHVNVHCWRNRLIDEGTDPRVRGLKKRTLVEDTLETCEDLLEYALDLERRMQKKKTYRAGQGGMSTETPIKKKQGPQVIISTKGSPTRHPPCGFLKPGTCLVCRHQLRTSCGHEDCGHLHRNGKGPEGRNCWSEWHAATAAEREKMKKKRVQPEVDGPEPKRAKRTVVRGSDKTPRAKRRLPGSVGS